MIKTTITASLASMAVASSFSWAAEIQSTNLYWGDTHLHTKISLDAYAMGNRSLGPDEAFRYAKGLPVVNAHTRHKVKIHTPLDFLVVADHAEAMGVLMKLWEGDQQLSNTDSGKIITGLLKEGKTREAFLKMVAWANSGSFPDDLNSMRVRSSIWQESVAVAEQHNEPGKFTSLIGWEWSSLIDGANLHRIVFMNKGAKEANSFVPYSMFDSPDPEDLWQWLDDTGKKAGTDFVAIPHNGNVSKGKMFIDVTEQGQPITPEYAKTRARWEPVYEMTQIKGDGETLAALSPFDEFAEFETYNHALDARPGIETKLPPNKGDYARTALMTGMEIEQKLGVNPFKFGMIGASDSHSSVAAVEEDNFGGKFPIDSYPEGKSAQLTPGTRGYDMAAAGLSAVWATENTRQGIFAAFKRKEVYATTGPRIALRLFAGWDFNEQDSLENDLASVGYRKGVPMGGDLTRAPKGKAPSLLIRAVKDPIDANLDRLQVVKGWLDENGKSHEKVFNVAASDKREIINNQLAPVGNTVDLKTAQYSNDIGASELATVWVDPEFNPGQKAFYYVRVLQIPTPRHTTYAAVALGELPPVGYPSTIQERAYSSPVWYTP